jgi:heme A synthase
MASHDRFSTLARLGLATTTLMYLLVVVGSVVRTTGSGLSCPDWPLCQGRLIPPLEPHVLIEWFHRLIALLVSVLVLTTVGWVAWHRELRMRVGGLAGLAVTLLVAQVLLGALTVWKLLSPAVVISHLAVALLLFSTLLTLTLAAQRESDLRAAPGARPPPPRPPGLLTWFGAVTALAYAQCLVGGLVSTNGAGTACPDWPLCNGQWFPTGLAGLQMLHRNVAYALVGAVLPLALRARSAPDAGIRAGATRVLTLTFAQVALGICNVLLGTPVWLSAAHLATAAALLAMLVITTFRVATLPASTGLVAAVAR